MKNVIESLDDLLQDCRSIAEKVDSDIADRQNDFRSMCFWNIHNRILMTKEILMFYNSEWNSMEIHEDDETEMKERVMTFTKDLFSDIVSSVEKSAKDSTYAYKMTDLRDRALLGTDYLYLRHIVSVSNEMGYIPREQAMEWNNILMMRNLVMHNNSEADRSFVFVMDDLRISMRPNRMMKGPITTFIKLSKKTINLYYAWLKSVDEACG